MAVYLIHFNEKLHHAQHYIGYTKDVKKRIEKHRNGNGAALLRYLNKVGILYKIVKIWKEAGPEIEQYLKRQKNTKRYCPICTNKPLEPKERS